MAIFTLAHLSDLHATSVAPRRTLPRLGKRGLGVASWQLRRRHRYRKEVLEALLRDLDVSRPDHVAITGDLTNVSLPDEFEEGSRWLARFGAAQDVTLVPGNHDAYVRVPEEHSFLRWCEYLVSDAWGEAFRAKHLGRAAHAPFPSLRRAGPVALVGLSSAVPTPVFLARGALGATQLEGASRLLAALGREPLARVLLVHHPPQRDATSWRRALRDAPALCAVLAEHGAELVLHGHLHRSRVGSVPGPRAPVPVVGVRSASHAGGRPGRVARYHLYDIEPGGRSITLRAREYQPQRGCFADAAEAPLRLGD